MRRWEAQRLGAWRSTGQFEAAYANLAFPVDGADLRAFRPDLVVFDATAMAVRQIPSAQSALERTIEALDPITAPRIAAPLDEFLANGALNELISRARVDRVYSPAAPKVWPDLYPEAARRSAVAPMLTAYLDDRLQGGAARVRPPGGRLVWLGYRTCEADPRFGPLAQLKAEIGARGAAWARARGLAFDVRPAGEGVKLGEDWLRFLRRTRVTVGVEGGASVLDRDGSLAAAHARGDTGGWSPPADLRPIELRALSPRHLEAAASGVLQVLVEGDYSGVLEAGRHYRAVKADLSDLEAVLEAAQDDDLASRTIETARREVVQTDRFTWRRKLAEIRAEMLG